ncbi:MAG: hypothetical protein JNM66_05430 [Bryobacterales bacterium]|nr:hypothetical protein [Bryobacterales bacterium]
MRQLTLITLTAALGMVAPIQYSFNAPAVTSGPVQGGALSFSFEVPSLLTGNSINLTALQTLVIPNPIDPAYPTLANLVFVEGLAGSFGGGMTFTFRGTTIPGSLKSSLLVTGLLDHTGTYSTDWQLLRFPAGWGQISGTTIAGTLTVTDLGTNTVPEPGTASQALAGIEALAATSRARMGA